jgi:tetratricopeptide (TPR) repeat protein
VFNQEAEARQLSFRDLQDDPADSDVLSGTVFLNARELARRPSYDLDAFRSAEPAARFGNLLVFRGEFRLPWLRAARKWSSVEEAQAEDNPDPERVAALLEEVVALYPNDIRASFELGNLRLEQGSRQAALAAYRRAREFTPEGNAIMGMLERQIAALSRDDGLTVGPLRNPWLE